jgi:PAS domain S-box-containing protein
MGRHSGLRQFLLLILFLYFFGAAESGAQLQELRFSRITLGAGLSNVSITAIAQDTTGFIWFGSLDGLNRYDGYAVKEYRSIPNDSNSLSNSSIRALYTDHKGVLWIGTEDGLNCYNPVSDDFRRFVHQQDDSSSISHNFITSICEDQKGELWIGTKGGGLNLFHRNSGNFSSYCTPDENKKYENSRYINSVVIDLLKGSTKLLIGTDFGLYSFDTQDKKFKLCNELSDNLNRSITVLLPENENSIWVGTWGRGLLHWDRKTNIIKRYTYQSNGSNSFPDNIITALNFDIQGRLWAGTRGGGMVVFPKDSPAFIRVENDPSNLQSLSDNNIYCSFLSKDGQIWIGTQFGGVNKYNPAQQVFKNYRFKPGSKESLSNSLVNTIFEDSEGILWIGTRDGGLNRIDRKKNSIHNYLAGMGKVNSLSSNSISCLTETKEGTNRFLWVGTDGGGLNRLNVKNDRWKVFVPNPKDKNAISNGYLYSMARDIEGNLWVGTWGTPVSGGLDKYSPKNESFVNFSHREGDSNSIGINIVLKVFIDKSENVWIGTKGQGVCMIKPDKKLQENGRAGIFSHFIHDPENPHSLSHNDVYSIYEDNAGNIWVGTFSGLNRYEPDIGGFSHYTTANGLPSNFIKGILGDSKGNLWISTSRGIACIGTTGEIKVFHKEDGLQDEVFIAGSCFKSSTGELFFGGINGFNSFYPDSLNTQEQGSRLVITNLKIYNSNLRERKNLDSYLHGKSLMSTREIRLTPQDFMISIEFAAIDYFAGAEKKYQYKLEGFSDEWIQANPNERRAVFTNLNPGVYIFRVNVTGSNPESQEGTYLKIIVTPPFYKTLIFKIALSLFIAFVLAWFFIRRIDRLLKEKLLIEKKAQESLFEERNQLRTLIDHIPDIIYIKDRNSRYIVANRELSRIMGNRHPEEIVGQTDHLYYPPDIANKYFNDEQELMRTGIPQINHIEPRYDIKGRKTYISTTKVPLRNSTGEVVGMVGISRDVSQLKKIEEQLMEQTGQLQDVNTAL